MASRNSFKSFLSFLGIHKVNTFTVTFERELWLLGKRF